MVPDSSPPVSDIDGGGLGFKSIRDRLLFRRNSKQRQERADVSSDRPASRSRSNHSRCDRRSWFTFGRKSFIALFLLCAVSLFLQTWMASVFMKRSEIAWSQEAETKFGITLKFMPRRFVGGNKLDRLRLEARRGVRKPRLALVLGKMEKDPQSLMLITVMKNLKELGYVLEIFAVDKGKAHRMWEQLGRIFLLSPEHYGRIDWSLFEGIIVDSVEVKEAVASIAVEPFCSIPLIWIIQDDILSKRLKMYAEMGWENLISHWRSTFSRASVIVFPNFALPMLYSALDTGNFRVIRGSPVDIWVAEIYGKSHFKYRLREDYGFDREDTVVLVVGSALFYKERSLEYAIAINSIGPLLTKYARKKNAEAPFKFVFLCGNSSEDYNDALQEIASRSGLLHGYQLRHYGFDNNVNDILLMADIVLYGSPQKVQDFPPLLIRAMTFGIPIVAPDLPSIKDNVVEEFHGILLSKYSPDALIRTFSTLISDGKLSKVAYNVASTGRLLAKNLLASECIAGYASLLEEVLNFPSDIMLPRSIAQLPKGVWEWDLFRKETEQRSSDEQNNENVKRKSSVVITLEEEISNLVTTINISSPGKEIQLHVIPTQQDWDIIEEIEIAEEYDRLEMEELQRSDRKLDAWEEVYRRARKFQKIKFEEGDEGELERIGQPVCIYEIYSGSAAWPFLHHDSLYRGLSLSTGALRLKLDDVDAVQRLPLLNDTIYQDILCEIGGMFAIANKIDTIHRRPWIGFQSWKAHGRMVSLSAKAEKALGKAIQENTRGEVIYFWACLDVDQKLVNSYDVTPFWTICDILNGEHCRTTFEDTFREMYGIPSHSAALPPMPVDGDRWSALHSWVMPTPTFMEFIMFSRMFVDSLDAVHRNFTKVNRCLLASSVPERRNCYCRLLEILVNVWAYHSGRRMVYLHPRSGLLEEQHLVEERQEFMWSKFFNATLLKAMDEDLAEAADDDDHPRHKWLWPLTGEVFCQGIYERERQERHNQKADRIKKRKTRGKKANRRKHGHKQKPLG